MLDTAWVMADAYVERKTHDEVYNIVYRYTPERLADGSAAGGPKMEEHAPGILRDLDLIFPKNSNNGTISSPPIIIGKHLPSYSVDELNEAAREETPWVIEGIAARGAVTTSTDPPNTGARPRSLPTPVLQSWTVCRHRARNESRARAVPNGDGARQLQGLSAPRQYP